MTSVTAECQEYGVEQGPGQQVEDSHQSREEAVEDDWGQDSQAAFVSVGRTYLPVRQIRARNNKARGNQINLVWSRVARSAKSGQVWHRIARGEGPVWQRIVKKSGKNPKDNMWPLRLMSISKRELSSQNDDDNLPTWQKNSSSKKSNSLHRHVNRLVKKNVARHTNGAWTPVGKRTAQR